MIERTLTRIRKLREFCGFAQEEVADKLGITQAAYSRLENGRTRLDIERAEQIAALYNLSYIDLSTKPAIELIRTLIDHPEFRNKWEG